MVHAIPRTRRHASMMALVGIMPMLMAASRRRGDTAPAPRDLGSLFDYLDRTNRLRNRLNNLLKQWGPQDRPLITARFLPPRLVDKNEDTIDRVAWRAVAAEDIARGAPVPILSGGQIFGSIRYKLRDSGMARQVTPKDYDAIVKFLNQNLAMQAAAVAYGAFDTMILQGLTEHDEMQNCDAIITGGYTRRGDNGYYEYINGPSLDNHRVMAGHSFSDPSYNPWPDIEARIAVITNKGFTKTGIRTILTDSIRTILKNNPYTAMRVGKSSLVLASDGTISAQSISGLITDEELDNAFKGLGVQAPISHDLRVPTSTGERRAWEEGALAFIGSTGQTEQVVYNQDNPSAVPLRVDDTIGFAAIGLANAQSAPGRQTATRVYDRQSDARVEMEGWQATGPVINVPEAISVLRGID